MKRIVEKIDHVGNAVHFEGQYYQPDGFVTFKQAFSEWQEKPIAWHIKDKNAICWIAGAERNDCFHIVYSTGVVLTDVPLCGMQDILKDEIAYQFNSWDEFSENGISTLMRMVGLHETN